MSDLRVEWGVCEPSGEWCDFNKLNLGHDTFENLKGVYVIWSAGNVIVRVGSGIIKDRIAYHRGDNEINTYSNLRVTWAKVPEAKMEAVEKFLADKYEPEVGKRFPERTPISINLPLKVF